jgi:small subunit ribosomal protein S6
MTDHKPIYDLVLLLDLGAEDDRRAKIVADARAAIAAEGELVGDQAWGTRPLSYEIEHREAADYHLLQFSGPPSLIADGVIRYRVIKLPPGSTPVAASAPTLATPAAAPATAPAAAEPVPTPPQDAPAADSDPALVSA